MWQPDPVPPAKHAVHLTLDEYLAFEASSTVKHEYLDGQIHGMDGGTPEHGALKVSVVGLLFAALRTGRCRVHGSDVRVRIAETGLTTYPDASVVCGPRALDPRDPHALANPVLLVEVTSPSTEAYDRAEKFEHYRRIPSLQEYLVVAHAERAIELRQRQTDAEWRVTVHRAGEQVPLASVGVELDVDQVYDAAREPE
jgi:Uma2 family endonuclease